MGRKQCWQARTFSAYFTYGTQLNSGVLLEVSLTTVFMDET